MGQALHHSNELEMIILKLDHNPIGCEGVRQLANGLALNKSLKSLSLTFCNIGLEGAQSIYEILIYQSSSLLELNLSGNHLKDSGVVKVLVGAAVAKSLEKLDLSDN